MPNLAERNTPSNLLQRFNNGEVHGWYQFVLGYSDKLVENLIENLPQKDGGIILDPFCGTGTTLVECKKRGIASIGIDASPFACYATEVKTTWDLDSEVIGNALGSIEQIYNLKLQSRSRFRSDPTYVYLAESGMIARGWISELPLRKSIAIKQAIAEAALPTPYSKFFLLHLMSAVVGSASNVRFGPELYCGPRKKDHDVWASFVTRVTSANSDLEKVNAARATTATVIQGDSRRLADISTLVPGSISTIICSPPYPAEHDYTRNTRLELAFLEEGITRLGLQTLKRAMVRSHTKGIYVGDNDSAEVSAIPEIAAIAGKIDILAKEKTHGFAKLYAKVLCEYFGGMSQHFNGALAVLRPNGVAAYVVGDQGSYLGVPVPTAELLCLVAERAGFEVMEVRHWRGRWATKTSKTIAENILILRKPLQVKLHENSAEHST